MSSEFSLIEEFTQAFCGAGGRTRGGTVLLGPGDDAALINLPARQALVITTDTLLPGVHFLAETPPEFIGYRSLAVNLSDLAAMGAEPLAFVVALTLPNDDIAFLRALAQGMAGLATGNVVLAGGNMSRGAFSITITALGCVPPTEELRRDGAQLGDDIYVSGVVGAGAAGLALARDRNLNAINFQSLLNETSSPLRRYLVPLPRLTLGMSLRSLATACIDVSDGLFADLSHVCGASHLGAELDRAAIPCAPGIDPAVALAASDDYELCFTVSPNQRKVVQALSERIGIALTLIGRMSTAAGIRLNGRQMDDSAGFDHFLQ